MNLVELLDRPIAFHRPFVELGLGVTGALFLSQAIYWSRRTNGSGWFYKTQDEWEAETGLTRREQETARKKLKSVGILEEKKQGVPCRVFYRINDQKLLQLLAEKSLENNTNPDCTEQPNQYGGKRQTSMAETAELDCTKAPCCDGEKRQTKTEITQRLPETTNKKILRKSQVDDSKLPKKLNITAWQQWIDYRVKIKKPFKTARGELRAMNDLLQLSQSDLGVQQRIVDQSIDFEWVGLFALKSTQQGQGKPSITQVKPYSDGMDTRQFEAPEWFRTRQAQESKQ
ncbi:MAG: hypothetical protein ACRCSE_01710 [Vibrio sp.]